MKVSACRLCYICVGHTETLRQTLFNHLNLFVFVFFLVHKWGKNILNILYTFMKIYMYVCIWTGHINRYLVIAEGLIFIMKFEKLPCFKKKKKKEQILSALFICYSSLLWLRHCSLPPDHFYKCVKTCVTMFCLLDNEKIYMNLKIL